VIPITICVFTFYMRFYTVINEKLFLSTPVEPDFFFIGLYSSYKAKKSVCH